MAFLAVHYPKAIEKLKNTNLFKPDVLGFVYKENFSFYLGMIANKIFDNPFIQFDQNHLSTTQVHFLVIIFLVH
ncbi:putative capsular polysaccharide modification protein [Escherichia coli]|uniref:Putative capsular polysaccharide modification protein n=1 Tax=Escherichia coli TaxID=562 RepID=A0A377K060_ECOLX|nr:putative capsular polysaccharide modification protein [Escherichia coli]